MFYEKLVHIMPTFKDKRNAIRISYDIERKLSNYLFAITLINAVLGIAIGVSMWLLGMPNPILFGVLAFAFNFVPYLGAIVGVAIAALVGLLTFDHTGAALLPVRNEPRRDFSLGRTVGLAVVDCGHVGSGAVIGCCSHLL